MLWWLCVHSGGLERRASDSSTSSVSSLRCRSDIDSPRHFRPIGRVLSHSAAEGTTTVELMRPPHGPYGIYLARDDNSGELTADDSRCVMDDRIQTWPAQGDDSGK